MTLSAHDLQVHFPVRRSFGDVLARRPARVVKAVDGVSLEVRPGELLALIGESGSGKSTTAAALLRMLAPTSGTVTLDGVDGSPLLEFRRKVQMIYQDPYESLSPRKRVADLIAEGLRIHRIGDTDSTVREALTDVGLEHDRYLSRYPHELSGGQRQRVAIACALALRPAYLLADEPVSMLDVSVRTGVLDVFGRLRTDHGLGILMITHDLATAAGVADRVAVMRDGRIVEEGPTSQVIEAPRHDYTRALIDAASTEGVM
jgi:peptide/nickel transport system ATP-binding protein